MPGLRILLNKCFILFSELISVTFGMVEQFEPSLKIHLPNISFLLEYDRNSGENSPEYYR